MKTIGKFEIIFKNFTIHNLKYFHILINIKFWKIHQISLRINQEFSLFDLSSRFIVS